MSKINGGRVIGGGLLAGLVINVVEFLVNGLWLAADWEAAMQALGKSGQYGAAQMIVFNLWGFGLGIFAVWLYAAIRTRYGPGSRTAYTAAVATWVLGYLMANIPPAVLGMFPVRLMLIGIAAGLIEVILATQLGAWFYKEEEAPVAKAAGT
ncbi:MAG: hypothetical protein LLG20_03495 [Acidobacteriales bacterium]|nr:hypothetical protein [Terriglobales bacterium]